MCGIIGIFAHGDPSRIWPTADLDAMIAALGHRGPDGWGKQVEPGLFFGHTRLAVLDLSPAGRQPMISPDQRHLITFNGEIYRFQELRRTLEQRGHRFTTQADTEVLLAAWVEWGEACLDRLNGIFAFAIYDRQERTLFLARDHLGVKPLFYWQDADSIAFASEPLALFGPIIPLPKPHAPDLDTFFTYNYLPAPATGLQNLRQLPPGHLLTISPRSFRLRPYWQLECPDSPLPWRADLVEQFQERLQRSVQDQLISDAPLGLFLSGGLDSTAVAVATRKTGHHPTAFTLGFDQPGFDERPAARECAHFLNLEMASRPFVWNELQIQQTLDDMRELLADASCFPMWQLARLARERVTVVLAGDGGDELLAGYDTYKAGAWTPWVRRIPAPLRRAMLALTPLLPADRSRYSPRLVLERLLTAAEAGPERDHASFRRIFPDALKARLYEPEWRDQLHDHDPIGDYIRPMARIPAGRSGLTARQFADLNHFLPGVLAKVDRMSMAHGLEVRVPLLDRELVEFCFRLPDEAKRFQGQGKRLLREMLAGETPPGHLRRPKAGFLPPVDGWFRAPGPMSRIFQDHLDWARHHANGWLRWEAVEQVWTEHRQGRLNIGFALLGILQFINWQKQQSRTTPPHPPAA
ncbi:MAG: asparagine synthase (glutamine-hydrolyzing) [Magnetococcales bacterium]|nr:asparagine synthase (glutamine-hydrolyzing) [Magnetococcales bacterium]